MQTSSRSSIEPYHASFEQEIHLRDYLKIISKRKATIVTFLVIVFLTVFISTFKATPYYTASSQVLIERNYGSSAIESSMMYMPYDPEFLSTQFELISSSNVTQRVVQQLKLDTKYKHHFFGSKKEGIFSFLSTFKNGLSELITSVFSSNSNAIDNESANTGELAITAEPMTEAEIIAAIIQSNLSIRPVNNTKTVLISYSDKNPAMAKLIIDAVVQSYMAEILEIKLASSNYSLQWMTSKADEERKKLESSEIALQQYMRDNDLVTVENKLAVYPQKLAEFSSQLSKAQAEQKEYESLNTQINNLGNNYSNIETIPIFAENKTLQNLRDKLFTSEQNLKDLSKKYGYKHPLMINAKAERKQILNEKKFEISRIIDSTRNANALAKSRETNLKQLLATTKTKYSISTNASHNILS